MTGPDELEPVLVPSLEWLVDTSLGHVGLEVELLAEEPAPMAEVRARWTERLHEAVRAVLARPAVGIRAQAVALHQELVAWCCAEGGPHVLEEWPAGLVLRQVTAEDVQLRVRAQLCRPAQGLE